MARLTQHDCSAPTYGAAPRGRDQERGGGRVPDPGRCRERLGSIERDPRILGESCAGVSLQPAYRLEPLADVYEPRSSGEGSASCGRLSDVYRALRAVDGYSCRKVRSRSRPRCGVLRRGCDEIAVVSGRVLAELLRKLGEPQTAAQMQHTPCASLRYLSGQRRSAATHVFSWVNSIVPSPSSSASRRC